MKIVVGYDGSDHGRRALERAVALIGDGGVLEVVHVESPRERHGPPAEIDAVVAPLVEQGIEARVVELTGDPADAIVGEATRFGAELIVVGTRGLNLGERLMLGSVSTRVVHHGGCDVLVVR